MKKIIENLKKQNFIVLLPVLILSCLVFLLALLGILFYGLNCGSEFNGNKVSENTIGFGIPAIIMAGLAFLMNLAGLFLVKNEKMAKIFVLSRIWSYACFLLLLAAFLFLILDEYSLLGTILYPIVSGAVGDPVDPVLSSFYFLALAFLIVASFLSLAIGIVMRKASHKIGSSEKPVSLEVNANE
ncbi:MAG: hypothetical protein J6038_02065 [Bacilli bacterium]|nr:hypothetical protein [Bacilli bacterium]